ncbi:cytochrome P450 [Zopfia rhizophila CBS 207.26]|uniref:Cytochrome P450 n=1 Tax=Zopfia rhizophila CBS 207.26 TaxID=1314779 RepID=A0A6A6F043_9PEZI|nr:cytochrome P450 [Zopfia rhizophila CBS 207.26]
MAVLSFGCEGLVRGLWIAVTFAVLYPLITILYNITLHPLSSYPGPLLWRSTRLAYLYSLWTGWLHSDVQSLHQKFGPVVRIAPDELSFADPAAWEEIYSNQGATPAFPKSALWHAPQPGRPVSVLNALDAKVHAKMRRKMDPAFTERAVGRQEGIVRGYVELMIEKLRERVRENGGTEAVVNVVQWYNFASVDIISDLAFGESFGCLEKGELDEWVKLIFNSFRAATLVANLRHYPLLNWVLGFAVPRRVKEKAEEHWQLVLDKVDKRLREETERPDFIAEWRKRKGKEESMELDELYANAFLIIIAGSETIATTISGITNRLVRNPEKLEMLAEEVRSRIEKEEDMTIAKLKELPYLSAVIWEGFRMCNPTPVGLPRLSPPEGGTVCGHWVPGNVFVNLHPLSLCFDPSRFYDPQSFHPERWLPKTIRNSTSPFYNDDRNSVQPFSIGPRSCIGRPLAMAELMLTLARMVWSFNLKEVDETNAGRLEWESQRTFTVVEKKPFEVKLIPRLDR